MASRVTNRVMGSIVLASTCLLALGSYVAVLSANDESIAGPAAQFRPRSFPHNQKEHKKVECAACHFGGREKQLARTDQPMAKDFPHATCVRCQLRG